MPKTSVPPIPEEAVASVYAELRRLAAFYLRRERSGHTLQPTALVHEAYLQLFPQEKEIGWNNRAHFFAVAANTMRRTLADHARVQRLGGYRHYARLGFWSR